MSTKINLKLNLIALLGLFFHCSLAHATAYYISNSGNDSNNGTSIATAWKTIERVNDEMANFVTGDRILFKQGDTWVGERLVIESISGTAANPIIFGAYGSGDLPILTAMEVQPHSWTNIGGNIWQANNPPAEHPERLLKDDIELLRANIQADLNGSVFFWRYDNAANDLYIYSITNPNTAAIKYATNFPLILENTSYINIQNIDFQGGWTSIFINSDCHHITFVDLNIGKHAQNGLISNTDSSAPANFPQDILINNCTFDAFFAFDYSSSSIYPDNSDVGVGDGFRPEALLNSEIRNCYFKNWGHASIDLNGVPDNGTDVKVLNISVHDNYMTSPDITYGGRLGVDDSDYCEVFRNQVINTSVQSQLNGRHNHYHHNIFSGTKNTPLIPDIVDAGVQLQGYSGTTVDHNIFEHNLILNCEGIGLSISGNNEYNIHDNVFRNNIIYNCGTSIGGKGIEVEVDEFAQTFNNAFQNNLVYSPLTSQAFVFRGNSTDIIGFQAATGADGYLMKNNLFGDPLLMNIGNEDYHLQGGSPCINAGATPLATLDYEGNMIPNSSFADIGLYELQSPLANESVNISKTDIPIYPNPTSDLVNIKFQSIANRTIMLSDMKGQILLQKPTKTIHAKIDISSYPNGIYFLKIWTNNDFFMQRIVKNK